MDHGTSPSGCLLWFKALRRLDVSPLMIGYVPLTPYNLEYWKADELNRTLIGSPYISRQR